MMVQSMVAYQKRCSRQPYEDRKQEKDKSHEKKYILEKLEEKKDGAKAVSFTYRYYVWLTFEWKIYITSM